MPSIQNSIIKCNPAHARHLFFTLKTKAKSAGIMSTLSALSDFISTEDTIVGIGKCLTDSLSVDIPNLKVMPERENKGVKIPSNNHALWCCLQGVDRGELFHRSNQLSQLIDDCFEVEQVLDCFTHDINRDLSGYVDGTENPEGDEALAVASIQDDSALSGSSFVAVQQWLHDFNTLDKMSESEKDDMIGRHHSNNEEFDEAPESAHVKRAEQEHFEPDAHLLRRSMPWTDGMQAGLVFVAFAADFSPFEAILERMLGKEDGIQDALFQFTQPLTGAYFWCPPSKNGKLDLSYLQ